MSRRIGLRLLADPPAVVGAAGLSLWLASAGAAGCADGPRVSPWGEAGRPQLSMYAEAADLPGVLARVDEETSRSGLALADEATVEDTEAGVTFVARAYEGTDGVGRPVHATRVASPFGVVLAVGPPREGSAGDEATELLLRVDAGGGRVARSLQDLDGDGGRDVILRAARGDLEIWALGPRGASPIDVEMRTTADRLLFVGPVAALAGPMPGLDLDVLAPTLLEVAAGTPGRFTRETDAARTFHAARRDVLREAPPAEPDDARLRRLVTLTWHALAAGDPRDASLAALRAAPAATSELARARDRHAERLERWFPRPKAP